MGVKGSWWRGGWNQEYADNHERIFGNKKEDTMRTTPEMYLEMWLSEQIPTSESVSYTHLTLPTIFSV